MAAFKTHFAFEFNAVLRNPPQLLMNYLFPLVFYVMIGALMTQIDPSFKDTIIPSMTTFTVLTSAILGLPGPVVQAREAGVYRSYKINGVPALSILSIPALTSIFHVLIVTAIVALTAPWLFGGTAPANWAAFVLVTLLMAFASGALGSLIGVLASTTQTSVLLAQMIFLPSMLLGGLMVPASALPESMRPISALLPTTYAMQAYVGLAYNQTTVTDPYASLIVLFVVGVVAFAAATRLFKWDNHDRSSRVRSLRALLRSR